ncbi:MarR family winged helix-turn-helix transcriptional regulator [Microbacterium sp.]|uniref:MarR family winged helix-turn-helix transcriptional regulator n=1 Tax=Microbacterium sp. TaxID=51671 RepID=UPI0039E31D76
MNRSDVLPSLVLSVHALGRIAARDAGNDAPATQWRTLSLLERGGPRRVGALAIAARTTQPGMTRLLGALERDGYTRRTPDPEDSRAAVVEITTAGSEALGAWRRQFREVLAPRFDDLDDDDWAAMIRTAEILAARTTAEPTGDER